MKKIKSIRWNAMNFEVKVDGMKYATRDRYNRSI